MARRKAKSFPILTEGFSVPAEKKRGKVSAVGAILPAKLAPGPPLPMNDPGVKKRTPSPSEIRLWRIAMGDVEPAEQPPAPPSIAVTIPVVERPPLAPPPLDPGLDRRTAQRLKRGQLEPEARLDLHGMTQARAHGALQGFLARSQQGGLRCVLVITGKGFRMTGQPGILRASVPRWLDESPNRSRLLGFSPAQPKDGGEGALYIMLRRLKS